MRLRADDGELSRSDKSRIEGFYGRLREVDVSTQDLIRSLIREVNAAGQKGKVWLDPLSERDGSVAHDVPIGAGERVAFRARLRQMRTWIGFAEFHVLARMLRIRFMIMMPQGGDVWRPLAVGDGGDTDIGPGGPPHPALVFTGAHYEVGAFAANGDGTFRRTRTVRTNDRGDCAFEALLTLYAESGIGHGRLASGRLRSPVRQFSIARAAHAGGDAAVMNRAAVDYVESITDLRRELALEMTDEEVDEAISAEGRLDYGATARRGASGPSSGAVAVAIDFSSSRLALPWKGGFAIQTKRAGAGFSGVAFAPHGSDNVYRVTFNFGASGDLVEETLAFVGSKHRDWKGTSASDGLRARVVSRKHLQFIYDELRDQADSRDRLPTHLGTALLIIETTGGTFHFVLGGANIDCGSAGGANASLCYPGTGNALHSEKWVMAMSYLILVGFGAVATGRSATGEPTDALLTGGSLAHFGTISAGGYGKVEVRSVRIVFLNALVMCGTCSGYWHTFREALLAAGIPSVEGEIYYYTDNARSI